MRRMIGLCCLLACLAWAGSALAQTWEIDGGMINCRWTVETFEGTPPSELEAPLTGSAFAGDAVIRGARMTKRNKSGGQMMQDVALLALDHEGAAMLAALVWDDGWQVRPVSETFLRRERDFGITVLSDEVWCSSPERCFLTVTYGEEAYLLSGGLSPWELIYYQRLDGQGGSTIIRYDPGTVKVRTLGEVLPKEAYWTNTGFLLPVYVECISADDYPVTRSALEAWSAAHPLAVAQGEGYVSGANLRQKATSSSRSLGMLTKTRVAVLDSAPGRDLPWYHVRIGGVEGWVSGNYCATPGNPFMDEQDAYRTANLLTPVARVREDASLLNAPDGTQLAVLPAGTMAHVLAQDSDWLLVNVPSGEITWQEDWAGGMVGFIRRNQAEMAQSMLYLKYGVTE